MLAFLNPMHYSAQTRRMLAFTLLRAFAGSFFFLTGYHQWTDHHFAARLPSLVSGWASQNPFFFYEDFLRYVVLPQAAFFAVFITWAELIVGGALILGLFARWASVGLMALSLHFFLATQHISPTAQGLYLAFLAIGATLYLADAGFCYGLDQLLDYLKNKFGLPFSAASTRFVPAKSQPKSAKVGGKKEKNTTEKSKTKKVSPIQIHQAFGKLQRH